MPENWPKVFLVLCLFTLAGGVFFSARGPKVETPAETRMAAQNPALKGPRETLSASVAKSTNRDKIIAAAVDNVFDGPSDPKAFHLVIDHIWKEDDLCLATVLLDYQMGPERWPKVFDLMLHEKGFEPLHSLLLSLMDAHRGLEIMNLLGTKASLAEPLLYAQFALNAGFTPKHFEGILSFLQKNAPNGNGASYYLMTVSAERAGRSAEEVENYLRQAFDSSEVDFGLMPFYQRLADAAELSGVNFLVLKNLDQNYTFTDFHDDYILAHLFSGKLRADPGLMARALSFSRALETYAEKFRALEFGAKASEQFFSSAHKIRYLFEHPSYGSTWNTTADIRRGGFWDVYISKSERKAFAAAKEKARKAFSAVSSEIVEDKADLCQRGDFDAFYADWKRRN